jgi:assimilatory nitrate reductase catalytic subunit
MLETPAFIQGFHTYQGRGLGKPTPFEPPVTYTVPADKRAQTIYFRAGNAAEE